MKVAKLIDPLEARNMRCPICSRKFEETYGEQKQKAMPSFQIRKKSIILLNDASSRTDIIMSSVNDSVRLRFSTSEDVWKEGKLHIDCKNQRHTYTLRISYEMNRRRLQTRNPQLLEEYLFFNDKGRRYELRLNYIENSSSIFDGSGYKVKPSILQISDKKDMIYKLDRLLNFQ